MANYLPTIKIYDIDYSFILKNYLDEALWNKVYTLLEYNNMLFTIRLDYINVQTKTIAFEVAGEYSGGARKETYSSDIWHSLTHSNIAVLKKQIVGAMIDLLSTIEKDIIITENIIYSEMRESKNKEIEVLTKLANDFLDQNGVSNADIREAYVDRYVCDNCDIDERMSDFIDRMKYAVLPDQYMLIAKITDNKSLMERVTNSIGQKEVDAIISDYKEIFEKLQTDEYEDEKIGNLEEIYA